MTKSVYTVPQSVEEYASRWRQALSEAEAVLTSFATSTPETTLQKLESLHSHESDLFKEASLLLNIHPDESMRLEAAKATDACTAFRGEYFLDKGLFTALHQIPLETLDPDDRQFAERAIGRYINVSTTSSNADFVEQYQSLQAQIARSEQDILGNIAGASSTFRLLLSELEGLPQAFLDEHRVPHEVEVAELTVNPEDWRAVMNNANSRATRQKMATHFRNIGYPNNTPHLITLLSKRKELSRLLGYSSYANFQLKDGILNTAAAVQELLDQVSGSAKSRRDKDLAELAACAPLGYGNLQHWDQRWLDNRLKQTKHAFDTRLAREFFPFNSVKSGVLHRMEDLFKVKFRSVKAETWHPDVQTYEILEDGEAIGRFFLDLHPRDNKPSTASFRPIRLGTPGQLPEGALICIFPRDDGLMEHEDVVSFFHEFGHMLHHTFAKQAHTDISGIPPENFAEVPSIMLERWAFDADTIKSFAKNLQGKSIPDDLVHALQRAQAQGRGINTCTQLSYAAMSLAYHGETDIDSAEAIDKISKETTEKYHAFPFDPNCHIAHAFPHLVHNGASYFSYISNGIMAADLFSRFKTQGLYNSTVAEEYKDKILRKGNSESIMNMMEDFLGRKHSSHAFQRELQEK